MTSVQFVRNSTESAAYFGFYQLREKRLRKQDIPLSRETMYESDVLWTGMVATGLRDLLAADNPNDDDTQRDIVNYFLRLYRRDGVQHCENYWAQALNIWKIYQAAGLDAYFNYPFSPDLQEFVGKGS